ncbi:MAG: hypothetical protein IJC85_06805 [Oscillospiraceae bacterium]|nr:hypothetical protein [Oscillospiraceae bacterium]
MKKDNRKIKEKLLDVAFEFVLMLVLFGIGALILGLFGVEINIASIDPEFVILVGIVALFLFFGIGYLLVKGIKKKK